MSSPVRSPGTRDLDCLRARLAECMAADRPALARRLRGLQRRLASDKPIDRGWKALDADLEASRQRRARRTEHLPQPRFPEQLPVTARRQAIREAVSENQVVVIAGETGSGKTTQLPKICLELGRGVSGMIGHTQPRRIAARSVAARIATELDSDVGHAVGYQVRFQDRVGEGTYVKLMTDGILLAETQRDPDLLAYDTLIIDEAHERSLNIDFLLGYLKRLLPKRPDLKLIITSATIDTERFSRHFGDAPVVEVSGRTFPVEVRYRPLQSADPDDHDRDLQQAIVEAVDELSRLGGGDVLVFLSGEREIREAAEALRKHHPPDTEILPLFARLSVSEQNRVFQAHGKRRIVLATNVAETSLTVPGIRYVVDTGLARISRYSHRSKVQRLPIERVSRASADQRAGRCGRVAPGVCIRLYDEDDYLKRSQFTEPEIQRTNLAAVILRMLDLGLGEVEQFPFVDPPDRRFINDGYRLLHELGAVDQRRRLTVVGKEMARLPIDPRIARMVLAAREHQCLREVLIIASGLTVQDPRERPLEAQQQADEAHALFRDQQSDFYALLNIWNFYHEQATHLSRNKLRRLCQEKFLAHRRMREWHDLHQQLANQVKDMGMRINQVAADYEAVHRALLAGLVSNIGFRERDKEFLGSHGKRFFVFPGSGLAKNPPKWVMAAEMVETARLFARIVAEIKPEWVEQTAGHLVRRDYREPHWQRRAGQVAAYERVSLYGITLIPRRRVNFGRIDPVAAHEIFVREALVHGQLETQGEFLHHNRELVDQIQALEDKSRRRDILVDEQLIYDFYAARVPDGIYSAPAFEKWRKRVEREDRAALMLDRDALMQHGAETVTGERYPDSLRLQGIDLPLEYHFEPESERDGVTAKVPLAALNALDPDRFDWLVPGLLREKLAQLIKTLPKALRRNFVPAPEFAEACMQSLGPQAGNLLDALGAELQRMTGIEVPRDAWRVEDLPDYLRMNFDILDEHGRVLSSGRDLLRLKEQLGDRAERSFAGLRSSDWDRDDVSQWDFGDLPETVELRRSGVTLRGYPALVVEEKGLALRVLDTAAKAEREHRMGVCRLFGIVQRAEVRNLRKNLPKLQQMCMHYAPVGSCESLADDLIEASIRRALIPDEAIIRNQVEFDRRRVEARARLVEVANETCAVVSEALAAYHQVAKVLKKALPPAWLQAVDDVRDQLSYLVYPGFVSRTPWWALPEYPRYLEAIKRRLEKLERDPTRDRRSQADLRPVWERFTERVGAAREALVEEPELLRYRWLLEELRVSLFAQELGTAEKVSFKRLEEQWRRVCEKA